MDAVQLNRLARQVADAVQQHEAASRIEFAVWRRGIVDPDPDNATGYIHHKGQRRHTFELGQPQILALMAQSDDQAVREIESLLTRQARTEGV